MLNLIRMNLFRLVHTRGVIVVFVLLMGFAVVNACMSAVESEEAKEWYKKEVQKEKESGDTVSDMAGNVAEGSGADGGADDYETDGKEEMQGAGSGDEAGTDGSSVDEDIQGSGEDIEGDNIVYDIGYEMGQKGASLGIYLATPLYPDGSMADYLLLYGRELSSGILLLFLLIAAIIFFWADEKHGFVKNIAGQTKHKAEIFLSKLIVIGIFTLASMLCYMLVEFASLKCGWLIGADVHFGMEHWKETSKVFITQYLLYMAFISGLLLLTEVTGSTAVGITIGVLGLFGFGVIPSAVVQRIFHTDFQMVKYCINTSITEVEMYVGWEVFRFALCVGGIFFLIYNMLHVLWFVKRDIV